MARFLVIEMDPTGADSRPLGQSGAFLTGTYSEQDVAQFASPEIARAAADRAPNRRATLELFVPGEKKRVSA